MQEPPQNSSCHEDDMKRDPYWGSTNVSCHRTNLNRPGICAPLVQGVMLHQPAWWQSRDNSHDRRQRVRAPVKKKCLRDPTKDGLAKTFYTKFESVIPSRRVSWAWSERVQSTKNDTTEDKNICKMGWPRAPVIFTRFSPPPPHPHFGIDNFCFYVTNRTCSSALIQFSCYYCSATLTCYIQLSQQWIQHAVHSVYISYRHRLFSITVQET